jgi:hypothetical protein
MQNSKTNPANPASQPQLPFNTAPINWLEPLAFKFRQLRDVSAAAERAGFRIVRLKVVTGGYEAQCERNHSATKTESQAAEAGKPFKETVTSPAQAR